MGGKNCSGELTNPGGRWAAGGRLLQQRAENSGFRVDHMMEVLRDTNSGINRPAGDFPTAGSQVSILGKQGGLNFHFYFFSIPLSLCLVRSALPLVHGLCLSFQVI